MKRTNSERILCVILALCLILASGVTAVFASDTPTQAQVYERIVALKDQYPDGTPWTNDNYYDWNGGIYSRGYGCAGFAFLLSDAAFGDLPARLIEPVDFNDVRVGDILRINGDTHSVIVLTVGKDSVTVAEGNYNYSVHWGRALTAAEVNAADYMLTRYPEEKPARPVDAMTDVPDDWSREGINYCMEHDRRNGTGNNTFSPNVPTTRGMLMTILARASGVNTDGGPTWYHKGMVWAMANNISDGTRPEADITREELVTMLWRQTGRPAASLSALNPFPDSSSVSPWTRDAVAWAVEKGLLNGIDGCIVPRENATRAEVAVLLMRWQKLTV